MNTNDVIDAYVGDVIRRLPRRERDEVGAELRGLLGEMLAERADAAGRPADDALVLAMLRDFGTPTEVAERYRPPGLVIIPAGHARGFVWQALLGVALQWALTLPRVFDGQPLAQWWLGWGLGAFWWPGFMVTMAMLAAWLRSKGWFRPTWRPRMVDPDRVERLPAITGLVAMAVGVALMVSLPWLGPVMPGPMEQVLAFDPGFLRQRAAWVVPLWLGVIAIRVAVLSQGRWSATARRLDLAIALAFIALLGWWITGGAIFQAPLTDEGAKAALGLVIAIIVVDIAVSLYHRRPRIRAPRGLA